MAAITTPRKEYLLYSYMRKIKNYINGKIIAPQEGNYIENSDPSTGKVYSLVADSDKEDVNMAVQAAKEAFPKWAALPAKKRSALLQKVADLITDNSEALAKAECIDNGKPLSLAQAVDIPRAAANMSFFATAILHSNEKAYQTDAEAINYTYRAPLGVVGCISPWNLPLYLFTWKIAPALAAGNTVVAKPSEVTPMTAMLFSELCIEAGLPAGVLNVVQGEGGKAGQAIVQHPEVKAISFTGGTATGRTIASLAAPMFKKLSLELGGKNPNIVFADCDLSEAVSHTVRSSFSNQGQICLCGSRIYVQRLIYDTFKQQFVDATNNLTIGDPLAENTKIGALVSEQQLDKVQGYVAQAQQEGGQILTGGTRVEMAGRCAKGFFYAPTIVEGLPQDCKINQEEVFGPVVTLTPFDEEDEVVQYANGTPYGLSATIWSQNIKQAMRVAHRVEAGIVWVNTWMLRDLRTPFGGMKQSGVGREGGYHALNFFTEEKNVCVKM